MSALYLLWNLNATHSLNVMEGNVLKQGQLTGYVTKWKLQNGTDCPEADPRYFSVLGRLFQ